ncbi:type 1 fimbrial protein [Salmonella enterica subsp. enterica]|uniref:Fimbrial protein n=4 Tax=Salmonella enterica I TaxID=59201 RepID=A0A624B9S8_SALMO|nr:fimbrial protein [Salmonella enterica]EAC2144149.1 type 1 fimbrial protein [Salmonella enterica subsp. enterica]EBZ6049703.1 type 1 fimbrial protein [Salmonella enterica subsp. enterica serovar Texas]ECS6017867.1 type 1 fimbrial protein [Salmonella enterica subsp. enterica serovar Rough O:k:1,5]ECS7545774.1 type 1 fimbrial protein [Salmonella enterica subsp. enterica serovar Denver]ECZ5263138.1 fimbrial protein [Salmonella enterica subsp. enterica serovar Montevideo]EDH9621583.1 type 1 fim
MKGKLAAVAFFAAMGITSSVMAQDGQVNFTGKIIEAGCKINGNVTDTQDIKLGEVVKTAFTAAGDSAATTKFSLVLTACPAELAGKPVSVKYDGTPDTINNDYLQLTGYGSATVASGVAIQLLNSDGSELPLGTASKAVTIATDVTDETTLDFFARYIATSATVTGGDANGTVNFTLTYN